jgi:hypothetical protein
MKRYKFLGDFVNFGDTGGSYGNLKVGEIYNYDDDCPEKHINKIGYYINKYPSDWEEVFEEEISKEEFVRRVLGNNTNTFTMNLTNFDPQTVPSFERAVWDVLHDVGNMLVEKNKKYGNSALAPSNIFSKLSALDSLKVRIDDKLSRIRNGSLDEDEDVTKDLIGYLILYRIEKYGKGIN